MVLALGAVHHGVNVALGHSHANTRLPEFVVLRFVPTLD